VPEILTAPDGQAAFRRGIERQPTRKELALEVPVRLITIENAQLIGMGLFAAKKWYPDLLACI
jgi:glucokinase